MQKIIFINHSNHPSNKWTQEQLDAAKDYCRVFNPNAEVEIIDVPFPNIDPDDSNIAVAHQAIRQAQEFEKLSLNHRVILHVMGEMTYTYNIVKACTDMGIVCIASTTERINAENPDGSKTVQFKFCQFRQY